MKEGWTKKECVPHVVRTEDQGGGWYLDTLSDGSQRSRWEGPTDEQEDFRREERQAWDRYASAVLHSQQRNYELTVNIGSDEASLVADAMLAERRKRFQAPGADKGGAS